MLPNCFTPHRAHPATNTNLKHAFVYLIHISGLQCWTSLGVLRLST